MKEPKMFCHRPQRTQPPGGMGRERTGFEHEEKNLSADPLYSTDHASQHEAHAFKGAKTAVKLVAIAKTKVSLQTVGDKVSKYLGYNRHPHLLNLPIQHGTL